MRNAFRPRSFVRVSGPAAEEFLDRMVSNDVAALGPGESCQALLLTPKARDRAARRARRRRRLPALTEPELGERVRADLVRARFATRVAIEPKEHTSHVAFGDGIAGGLRRAGGRGTRRGARAERLARGAGAAPDPSRNARLGQGDRRPALPAEAVSPSGRSASRRAAIRVRSRSPGCTTAATPTAACACSRCRSRPSPRPRSSTRGERRPDHERGRRRRRRRRTRVRPSRGAGRRRANGRHARRYTDRSPAPVAQGIERCPAEAEVACSNHAGRTLMDAALQHPRPSPTPARLVGLLADDVNLKVVAALVLERRRRLEIEAASGLDAGLGRALARAAEQRRPRGAGAGVAGRPRGARRRRALGSRSFPGSPRAGGHPPQLRRRDRSRAGATGTCGPAAPPARVCDRALCRAASTARRR